MSSGAGGAGITLMREAIMLNRTNHAVSMVSTGDKGLIILGVNRF